MVRIKSGVREDRDAHVLRVERAEGVVSASVGRTALADEKERERVRLFPRERDRITLSNSFESISTFMITKAYGRNTVPPKKIRQPTSCTIAKYLPAELVILRAALRALLSTTRLPCAAAAAATDFL